jgi:hypothetical protein
LRELRYHACSVDEVIVAPGLYAAASNAGDPDPGFRTAQETPMILSRVVARLREQQWAAVFIELVIVVLGVFIGIQASNWNAAQADRRKGEQFAARLLIDLREDLVGRERMVAYYQAVEDSARKVSALLGNVNSDPEALVVNAYRATEMNYYTLFRATWDELVSSGEIAILPPYVDKDDVSRFFTFDVSKDTKDAFERSPYRQRVRRIIPQVVQDAIRAGCGDLMDEIGNVVAFKPECRVDLPPTQISAAAAALASDPDVLPDLRLHFTTINFALAGLSGDVVLLKRAIASFDARPDAPGSGAAKR